MNSLMAQDPALFMLFLDFSDDVLTTSNDRDEPAVG